MPEQTPLNPKNWEQRKAELAQRIAQLQREGKVFIPVTPDEIKMHDELLEEQRNDDMSYIRQRYGRG